MSDGGRRWLLLGVLGVGVLVAVQQARLGSRLLEYRLVEQTREALAQGRVEEARAQGEALLRIAPVSPRSANALAAVAVAREDDDQAVRLYGLAASRDLRDVISHAWLADHHGRRGAYAPALRHLGLLIDVHPSLRAELFPALAAFMATSAGLDATAGLLSEAPPWRQAFLAVAARESEDVEPLVAMHRRFAGTPAALTAPELAPVLDRMVRDGNARRAWLLFAASLPEESLVLLGNVFNDGFEAEPTGLPFDWRFGRVPGALVERVEVVDDRGERSTALHVEFLNRRVAFRHVSQLLVLDPGRYRLHGRVRLEGLRNDRGLEWVVQCAEGGSQVLGRTERFSGTSAWAAFQADVEVPPGCAAQWLRLQLPARIDSERQVVGRIWFDGVRISRQRDP